MFVNKVPVEVKGVAADGRVIVVREIGEATSMISYEDAWKKAHAAAKKIAEHNLEEQLKHLNAECHKKVECVVGERGFPGPRGPMGPPGPANTSSGYYSVSSDTDIIIPSTLKSKNSSKASCTLTRSSVGPFFVALEVLQQVILQYGSESRISSTPSAALDTFLEAPETKKAFEEFLVFIIEYCPLECMIENGLIFIKVEPSEYEYTNKVTVGIATAFKVGAGQQ